MEDENKFSPAILLQQEDGRYELCLSDFSAGYALADERKLQGGGYTWQALVRYLVRTRAPEHQNQIDYDSEGDTFVAMSERYESICAVGRLVQGAIHDPKLLREAFDNADPELDELE